MSRQENPSRRTRIRAKGVRRGGLTIEELEIEVDLAESPKDRMSTLDDLKNAFPFKAHRIFIGHGHSDVWRDLRDFLTARLHLEYDEFNRTPVAGRSNKERLEEMLNAANFAFLVMTAEDERVDGTLHARENVIHEAGLFQGRLGFEKAILLLEDGCASFSNVDGVGQIRFPAGDVMAQSEGMREVLEREGVIRA
jgi:predicted nucleotide-binding protein